MEDWDALFDCPCVVEIYNNDPPVLYLGDLTMPTSIEHVSELIYQRMSGGVDFDWPLLRGHCKSHWFHSVEVASILPRHWLALSFFFLTQQTEPIKLF